MVASAVPGARLRRSGIHFPDIRGEAQPYIAYEDIDRCGLQGAATIITISPGGRRTTEFKNAYLDYGIPANGIYTDRYYYKGERPEDPEK